MQDENVFEGKTKEEAIQEGLLTLAIPLEDAEITVIEEGKKKLFGSSKWKVKVQLKKSDGERAAKFIDGLLKVLGVEGESKVVAEDENIKIEIDTPSSARVIGKRGDVLDAIQCMAGAVANIGRDDYIKVVVDCENYRSQREDTLIALANKVAAKAVETGRKVTLEPMNPYERRIIHSALVNNGEVKTVSEGREPVRYIVVIPNNAKPGEKSIRYGDNRHGKGERGDRHDRRGDGKRGERRERGGRRDDRRGGKPAGGAKRGKKEIYFGTYLGNSGAGKSEEIIPEGEKPQE